MGTLIGLTAAMGIGAGKVAGGPHRNPPFAPPPWGDDPPRANPAELDRLIRVKNPAHDNEFPFVYRVGDRFRVRFRLFKKSDRLPDKGCYVSLPGRFPTADHAARVVVYFLRVVYGPDWHDRPVREIRWEKVGREWVSVTVHGVGPAFKVNGRLKSPVRAKPSNADPARFQADALLGGTGNWRPVESSARDGCFPDAASALAFARGWWLNEARVMGLLAYTPRTKPGG